MQNKKILISSILLGICLGCVFIVGAYFLYFSQGFSSDSGSYEIYMSSAKIVTTEQLLTDYPTVALPTWLPPGVVMTAVYEGPDVIVTYSNNGDKDFRTANVAIEFLKSSPEPVYGTNSSDQMLITVGYTHVAIFPNAGSGYSITRMLYPTSPYCYFFYKGIYYQMSARGYSTDDLIKIVASMIGQ